jgi:hypothetical protein
MVIVAASVAPLYHAERVIDPSSEGRIDGPIDWGAFVL